MAATSFEHGDYVRAALSELIFRDFRLKTWKLWASRWPHFLVIDAKTGFDVLNNDTQTSDRKVQIDLAVLKQALTESNSNSFVKWVPGRRMLADATTKWYDNGSLALALKEGRWSLMDTQEAMDLRRSAAERRQATKRKTIGGKCQNMSS